MFKVNDYVSSSSGVCQIVDITKDEYGSSDDEYFVLRPVFQNNMTVKIPVNNPTASMRRILTKDEVLSLIATMPRIETLSIDNYRERSNIFKATLKTRDCEELIKIIRTLYLEKQEKTVANKKLPKTDEYIMNTAEKNLYEEFAVALNISPEEVVPFITEYIEKHEVISGNGDVS